MKIKSFFSKDYSALYIFFLILISFSVNQYYDMPNLLMDIIAANKAVSVFPVHEAWLDVGREHDYLLAQQQYEGMI